MKAETLTVKACEVRAGDRICGELVMDNLCEGCVTLIQMSGLRHPVRIPDFWPITISRPVPDPCPRGRMTYSRHGTLMEDKRLMSSTEWESVNRRIVALWNEAESATPYRTTAEIEEASK